MPLSTPIDSPPPPPPAAGSDEPTTPGLDLLRSRLAAGPVAGVAELVGMRPVRLELGTVAFAADASARFANPMGTVHGGIIATLLDSAMACAVQSTLPEATMYTTLGLEVKYLRPVALDAGEITATGTVVHAGRKQATAEGRLTDSAGRVLATATTTCLIIPL